MVGRSSVDNICYLKQQLDFDHMTWNRKHLFLGATGPVWQLSSRGVKIYRPTNLLTDRKVQNNMPPCIQSGLNVYNVDVKVNVVIFHFTKHCILRFGLDLCRILCVVSSTCRDVCGVIKWWNYFFSAGYCIIKRILWNRYHFLNI